MRTKDLLQELLRFEGFLTYSDYRVENQRHCPQLHITICQN